MCGWVLGVIPPCITPSHYPIIPYRQYEDAAAESSDVGPSHAESYKFEILLEEFKYRPLINLMLIFLGVTIELATLVP